MVCPANAISLDGQLISTQLSHGTNTPGEFKVFIVTIWIITSKFNFIFIMDQFYKFMTKYAGRSSN